MNATRRVAIIGVTGFVGRGLPALLADAGFATTGYSRKGDGDVPGVDQWRRTGDYDFTGHHAIINLAGAPIDQRWTDENRRKFHESRVGVTTRIVEAIAKIPENARPEVLVNGSAVGYYGDRGDEILKESARPGRGFLADLCSDWEDAAKDAESLGVRVVLLRTGIVMGNGGGTYERMRPIFKLGLGGPLGSGKQWMPWIHLADQRAAIVHAVTSATLAGPANLTAPTPERNQDLTRMLGRSLHRPAIFPAPAFALRLVLGEFATAVLASERAVPAALEADGFQFKFPTLETALADLAVK